MKNEERKPTTLEQTHDPDTTRIIVDILKEINPEYAETSFNLIDCIERMIERILHTMFSSSTAEESIDAVKYLFVEILAESIEEIHNAMVRDYEDGIKKL